MTVISTALEQMEFNRSRTLGLLDEIASLPNPQQALGWRPADGRAHIAWQLLHIGVTEELFATERLTPAKPDCPELVPRFKGGSTPDDDIPAVDEIRSLLDHSRNHLKQTLSTFSDADLATIPEPLRERGWSLARVLQVLNWHEAHHQGQAHITLNLWKAAQS